MKVNPFHSRAEADQGDKGREENDAGGNAEKRNFAHGALLWKRRER